MTKSPRVLLLNGTCLDVIDAHRDWLRKLSVDVVAKQEFRHLAADDLAIAVEDADAIIIPAAQPVTPQLMNRARRLRVISLAASGYDTLDVAAATSEGIVVTNAAIEEGAEVVADMAWGLMLAIARQIPQHDRQIRSGNLDRGMGTSLWRRTLGIVGLGNIGRAVARRAAGFEMKILATDPRPHASFVPSHNVEIVDLEELLARSDFVTLHVRLNDSTRHMFGSRQFAQMKPTAFLVNTARRELIDEQALIRALHDHQLAGAALDDPPSDLKSALLDMDNVIFTTHLGNRARVGVDAVLRCAVRNTEDILMGRTCSHVVNKEVFKAPLRTPH